MKKSVCAIVVILCLTMISVESVRVRSHLRSRQQPVGLRMLTKFLTEDNSKLKDQGAVFDETGMDGLDEPAERSAGAKLKQKAKSAAILFMRSQNKDDLQAYGVDSDFELANNPDWKSFMVLMMNSKGDHELVKVCVQMKDNQDEGGQIAFVIQQNDYCRSRFSLVEQSKYERAQMTMTQKQKQKLFDKVIQTDSSDLSSGAVQKIITETSKKDKKIKIEKPTDNDDEDQDFKELKDKKQKEAEEKEAKEDKEEKSKQNEKEKVSEKVPEKSKDKNSDQYELIQQQMKQLQKQLENMKPQNNTVVTPLPVQNVPKETVVQNISKEIKPIAKNITQIDELRFAQSKNATDINIQNLLKEQAAKFEKEISEKIQDQNKSFKRQIDVVQRQIDNLYEKVDKKE